VAMADVDECLDDIYEELDAIDEYLFDDGMMRMTMISTRRTLWS